MTGMIFIFMLHFIAGNMHCKIKQREEEHCRDSKYLLKTGLHALKSEAMEERIAVCPSGISIALRLPTRCYLCE